MRPPLGLSLHVPFELRIYCRSDADVPHAELEGASEAIRREPDSVLADAVGDVLRILDVSRPSKGRDRLREHLSGVVQLITVRREGPSASGDPSSIEAAIARTLDGVIEAPESGRSNRFFDAKLRRFYRL